MRLNMHKQIIIFILICPYIFPGRSTASVDISRDAGVVSMGGAYEGSKSNVFAVNYNPAGIANMQKKEFSFSYGGYTDGLSRQSAAFGIPLSHGVIGASASYFDEESSIHNKFHNLIGIISYGYPVYEDKYFLKRRQVASAGINFKVINKKLSDDEVNIFAVDLGVLYKWPFERDLNIGIAFRNIGGEYEILDERKRLPSSFEFNISKRNFLNGLSLAVNSGILFEDENVFLNMGAEYSLGEKILNFNDLLVRIGFTTEADKSSQITSGFGVRYRDLSLDYGAVFNDKANVSFNIVSLGYEFGYIKEDPLDIENLYRLGKKYYLQGNLRDARQKFEKVRVMNKDYKETMQYLEQIRKTMLQLKRNVPLADGKFYKTKSLMENGNRHLDQGNYKEAINYYTAVLIVDENNEDAKQKIRNAKQKISEIKEKEKLDDKKEKEKALERKISGYYGRGMKHFESKNYNQALAQYKKGKSLINKSVEKKWTIKFRNEIKKTKRKLAETYYEQGYVYYQQNKLEEAIKKFSTAINYNPNYGEAKEKLKEVRGKLAQINKKKAERLYEQGMDEYTVGNIEKAVGLWKEALKYNKNHIEAKKAIERVEAGSKD